MYVHTYIYVRVCSGYYAIHVYFWQDYPSPGQILSILQRENIFPVFITIVSSTQASGFYNLSDTHEVHMYMYMYTYTYMYHGVW